MIQGREHTSTPLTRTRITGLLFSRQLPSGFCFFSLAHIGRSGGGAHKDDDIAKGARRVGRAHDRAGNNQYERERAEKKDIGGKNLQRKNN